MHGTCIYYLDSMYEQGKEAKYVNAVVEFLAVMKGSSVREWKQEVVCVPQQKNNNDCGVIICKMAELFMVNRNIVDVEMWEPKDMENKHRSFMAKALLNGEIPQ